MAERKTENIRRDQKIIKKEKQVLTLLCDTRQQEGQHKNIEAYCRKNGIKMVRQCLSVGDYMFPEEFRIEHGYPLVSCDTKASILELAHNIMSSDHRRFKAECIRALSAGIQLVIVIEEMPPFGRLDMWEVPRFQSSGRYHRYGDPMTLVDPAALRKACITMQEKYHVKFRFCTRRQSPARVIKYLKGELK